MKKEKLEIYGQRAFLGNLVFDLKTGMLNIPKNRVQEREVFSGVRLGKVFVKNRLTTINAEKFMSLPKTVQERILKYPNSDYARDILAHSKGDIKIDTFPNFNSISYTAEGKAIILHDEEGEPIRKSIF